MAKESGDVAKAIRLVPMNRSEVVHEGLFEAIVPNTVQLAETFANEAIEG